MNSKEEEHEEISANREHLRKIHPMILAFLAGEEIQEKRDESDIGWHDFDGHFMVSSPDYSYRIKPKEPRKFWIHKKTLTVYKDESKIHPISDFIPVIEILEEE